MITMCEAVFYFICHNVCTLLMPLHSDVNSGRKGEKGQEIMDGVDPYIQVSMISCFFSQVIISTCNAEEEADTENTVRLPTLKKTNNLHCSCFFFFLEEWREEGGEKARNTGKLGLK